MLERILNLFGREYTCGVPRSNEWPALRRKWLKDHPTCEVCGTEDDCVPHHVEPVHLCPSKELDESNLMTLCAPHHLLVGHLMCFRSINPDARCDAKTWRLKIAERL